MVSHIEHRLIHRSCLRQRRKKARRYGSIVFEENDPQVIEDIIKRMGTFGEREVKMAFDIVAKKRPDNPKRCYLYVKGIIDKSR